MNFIEKAIMQIKRLNPLASFSDNPTESEILEAMENLPTIESLSTKIESLESNTIDPTKFASVESIGAINSAIEALTTLVTNNATANATSIANLGNTLATLKLDTQAPAPTPSNNSITVETNKEVVEAPTEKVTFKDLFSGESASLSYFGL